MSRVTWGDDSIRIRLFQTALRISAHFYDAVNHADWGGNKNLLQHLEDLNKRWLILSQGQEYRVDQYPGVMVNELLPWQGQPIFDHIRVELAKPFAYEARMWQVNQSALNAARACINAWGGAKAKERIKQLALLPLHGEKTGDDDTQFSFDRADPRILIGAGSPEMMLMECMLLEFSLFHEYLSHAFPSWSKDSLEISEGFLFALEFEWLQSEYSLFDYDLALKLWHPRLEKERDSFRTAQWLFRRCGSYECVKKFLLEWVAGWGDFPEADHADLLSQLKGAYNKIGSKFGKLTPKSQKILKVLDGVLCGPCPNGPWNIKKMKDLLGAALDARS
jgi:hypothetical protein